MRSWKSAGYFSAQVWDRILIGASYLYLVIPIVIFLFGWLRLPLALLIAAVLLFGTVKTLASYGYTEHAGPSGAAFVWLSLLIVAGWVFLSGIDAFGFQNSDFAARNAIFRDLVARPWPVTYDYRTFPALQATFGDTGALVYYFTFWLPCALAGKLLGWDAANHALLAWSILGVFLSLWLICRFIKAHAVLLVVAFILMSGMDIAGSLLYDPPSAAVTALAGGPLQFRPIIGQALSVVFGHQQLEAWASTNMAMSVWQYSSFTTQLFWVFNQAIPAWLATALLLNQQDRKSLVFTFSLAMLFAPLPAIGLLPFLVYRLIEKRNQIEQPDAGAPTGPILLQSISFQNIVVPAALAFVALAFLGTQRSAPVHGFVWEFVPFSGDLLLRYAAFCMLEFLVFGLLVMRPNQDRRLLTLALSVLLLTPLYVYGTFSDLVMRASIPALLVVFMIGFRNLLADPPGVTLRSRLSRGLVIAVLLIGAITPLHEIGRSTDAIVESEGLPPPTDSWSTLAGSTDLLERSNEFSQYVLARPEDTFFFRFLARNWAIRH